MAEWHELTSLVLVGIFVQIGLVPNTEWLKGDIALSPSGEIEIGSRGEPQCAASLPPVMSLLCRSSRSLFPWAAALPQRSAPSIT
ncbi:hypothetical protein A8C75_15940 [Marinobacterium aestuarii]|uniref:Uncharacterized protein n=1 Tax=Marinobacterium aestuarii TaxID=1821621 RepID=A0A1A9F234_9GAMM|nr:hypothetical protein A8C75_15940 [Marinobacterium aestuarii]